MAVRWERTGEYRVATLHEVVEGDEGPEDVLVFTGRCYWILRKVEEPTLGQKLVSRVQDIHDSLQPLSEGDGVSDGRGGNSSPW